MKVALTPHIYKQIAVLALTIGILTNYYIIAIFLDCVHILLASSGAEISMNTAVQPLHAFLKNLAPISYISLLISAVFYMKLRHAS